MDIGDGIPSVYLSTCPTLVRPGISFDEFVSACNGFIAEHDTHTACARIVQLLPALLLNREVTSQIIPDRPGRHILYEKSPGELTILGHNHPTTVWSKPHDHGATWAIYGVVESRTAMNVYRIVTLPRKGHKGTVRLAESYWINPGHAYYYPIGGIHSHSTEPGSKLIRIEGANIKRPELKLHGRNYIWVNG